MTNKLIILIICLLSVCPLSGDLAPIRYEGYTLSAKGNPDIRMEGEEVNIYCGQRCRVTAKFAMLSTLDKPIDLFVGFPVQEAWARKQEIYDFQVRVTGHSEPREVSRIRQEADPGRRWTWFGWDQTFSPGRTLIEVEYHIEPSPSYGPPWQSIYYVLETGKYWRGTIGQAQITVHFDRPLAAEQIRERTSPKGFKIDGDKVCWRFNEFVPAREDNICLEYMPFNIHDKLQRLRHAVEQSPGDEAAVVELARHYFALGHAKGLAGPFYPHELTPDEFRSIISKIDDPNDRGMFEDIYRRTTRRAVREAHMGRGSMVERMPGNDEVIYAPVGLSKLPGVSSDRIVHILGAADYTPASLSEYVIQARQMLERLLEKNPSNGDAWMLYLSHYWRFKYGGPAPPPWGWPPFSPDQERTIKQAYAHCPSHDGIRAWYESIANEPGDAPQIPVEDLRYGLIDGVPLDTRYPAVRLLICCQKMGIYKVQWEP